MGVCSSSPQTVAPTTTVTTSTTTNGIGSTPAVAIDPKVEAWAKTVVCVGVDKKNNGDENNDDDEYGGYGEYVPTTAATSGDGGDDDDAGIGYGKYDQLLPAAVLFKNGVNRVPRSWPFIDSFFGDVVVQQHSIACTPSHQDDANPQQQQQQQPIVEIFRDWNDEFQALHERQVFTPYQRQQKQLSIDSLLSAFTTTAELVATVIVREMNMPDAMKTIPPKHMGGRAGGLKYVHSNIIFKLAVDFSGLYKFDEFAMKSATNEVRHMSCVTKFPSLHTTLSALFHVDGSCVFASALAPVSGDESLVMGSSDGGRTVHNQSEELQVEIVALCDDLHLKPHRIAHTEVVLRTAGDVEGHEAADGRLYMLDLGRLSVPQPPRAGARSPEFLFYLFRPDFLRSLPSNQLLCPDTYAGWGVHGNEQHAAAIDQAMDRLRSQHIPNLVAEIVSEHKNDDELSFASVFHSHGVNMRHMGLVYAAISSLDDNGRVRREQLVEEMICRVVKTKFRDIQRHVMKAYGTWRFDIDGEVLTNARVLDYVATTLVNLLTSSSPSSHQVYKRYLVEKVLVSDIAYKFMFPISSNTIITAMQQPSFRRRLLHHLCVVDDNDTMRRLVKRKVVELSTSDIMSADAAEAVYLRELDIRRAVLARVQARDKDAYDLSYKLVTTLFSLLDVYGRGGEHTDSAADADAEWEKGRVLCDEIMDLYRKFPDRFDIVKSRFRIDSWRTGIQHPVIEVAWFHEHNGRFVESIRLYDEAISVCRQANDDDQLIFALNQRCRTAVRSNETLESTLFEEAVALANARNRRQTRPLLYLSAHTNMSVFYATQKQWAEARSSLEHVLEKRLQLSVNPDEDAHVASCYHNLGLYTEMCQREGSGGGGGGGGEDAKAYYQKCLDIRLKALGGRHKLVAAALSQLAFYAEGVEGDWSRALTLRQQALEILQNSLPRTHPLVSEAEELLHRCEKHQDTTYDATIHDDGRGGGGGGKWALGDDDDVSGGGGGGGDDGYVVSGDPPPPPRLERNLSLENTRAFLDSAGSENVQRRAAVDAYAAAERRPNRRAGNVQRRAAVDAYAAAERYMDEEEQAATTETVADTTQRRAAVDAYSAAEEFV